jgi:hypothetical protein
MGKDYNFEIKNPINISVSVTDIRISLFKKAKFNMTSLTDKSNLYIVLGEICTNQIFGILAS